MFLKGYVCNAMEVLENSMLQLFSYTMRILFIRQTFLLDHNCTYIESLHVNSCNR
jgi:hypothetical protein